MTESSDGIASSPESYLERFQVLLYLEDSISQLLEYKDDNPKVNVIKFMNEYFQSVKNGTHVMFREFEFINATLHNRKSFIKLFWKCFQQVGKKGDLLTIQEYHSLICLLCSDFPFELVQKTARIVMLDDALEYLISFTDFLYAFQIQFCYQEFIEKCREIYSVLCSQRSPRDPVVVPTSDLANVQSTPANNAPPADGVETASLLRAVGHLCKTSKISSPAPDVLQDILTPMATVRVSFYEFLMILAKSETVNNSLGILPSRLKVFENNDTCNSLN
ncbi:centriolar satellite-associated tubulin polyglutamylase complex regulator 1 isoform X2 [Octopus bimaculoides]|uniref:Centriolar satellite-associated tubulin polyglutamylase complex regulator 1 n=1 Tax=Octopus bimaculoides TaxID=37653 RepID=A0A0L8GUV6_OCTBM|nr:centriolar satellite-associated tubulin polyglutamylase complex regulator 1 isoform X2 [Octopus bimaculoides]|eukprot:XP_014777827.1 PREDICTED: UPF0705 protein C11orf49 homolog isoform X2 [Octopus bimaculoides]